jgi:RimJ/RimL family protein N-acetyltransferase
MDVEPLTLEGEYVRLEPLSLEAHLDATARRPRPGPLRVLRRRLLLSGGDAFVETALDARDDGTAVPFATVRRESGEVVGSTRCCSIRPENRGVEVGWTWITQDHLRTPANTEAEYLMLEHAFEAWGCVRVEFETAAGNDRSREALGRIGATEEGTLRKHMLVHGESTDSVYFSVVDDEWPEVKRPLRTTLDRSPP